MNKYQLLKQKIDEVIDKNLKAKNTTGVVTLVYQKGYEIYRGNAGMADIEAGIPISRNTLFRFASISKAFTSLAIAALVSQGKICLTDPVTKWLPYFSPALPDGSQPPITIKNLLRHMSGLDYRWAQTENGPYAKEGVSDGLDITAMTLEDNLRRLANAPLAFYPGTNWLYSLAPDVLGAVIAKAYGTDFPTAMLELVLAPLGISNTHFYIPSELRSEVAGAYYLNKQKMLCRMSDDQYLVSSDGRYFHFSPKRVFIETAYPSGGVGLIGTADDLMKIVEVIRTGNAPFADKELLLSMSENQLRNQEARPGLGFGLGWGILVNPQRAENTPQSIGTRMWGGVYGSKWFTDPSLHLSVVSMTTTALDETVSADIRDAIYSVIR